MSETQSSAMTKSEIIKEFKLPKVLVATAVRDGILAYAGSRQTGRKGRPAVEYTAESAAALADAYKNRTR